MSVVDKGRSVGGRLATRRIGGARLDHGAQFFTVRGDDFGSLVDEAIAAGIVHEWCAGFDDPPDGYPRYTGSVGMNGLAKWLARDIDVRTRRAGHGGVGSPTGSRAPPPMAWSASGAGMPHHIPRPPDHGHVGWRRRHAAGRPGRDDAEHPLLRHARPVGHRGGRDCHRRTRRDSAARDRAVHLHRRQPPQGHLRRGRRHLPRQP